MKTKRSFFPWPRPAGTALLLALVSGLAAFSGCKWLTAGWRHLDMSCALDAAIPLFAPAVVVYLAAFPFWALGYMTMACAPPPVMWRFFAADGLARAATVVCFLLAPTTLARPEVTGGGGWNALLRLVYACDTPDALFPSLHCLISWLCWAGVRARRELPGWYRWFSLGMAVAVCLSTLLTKQHVFWDVPAGILLAEGAWRAAAHPRLQAAYARLLQALTPKRTPPGGG